MTGTLIAPPEGYEATRDAERASHVLRYLLTAYPNVVIGHADVVRVLGYEVVPSAVTNAAKRMRAGAFGLNIESRRGTGGGYVLLTPVPATGRKRCAVCRHRSIIETCGRQKGRPVEPNQTCWGWEA